MKKILLLLLLGVNLYGFAQNKAWILAPKYFINNGNPGSQMNLPTAVGGYQGAAAIGAQNIITDASGQITFFIVDEYIYDRSGNIIDRIELGINGDPVNGVNSEISVVKDQTDCNIFHIFTTMELSLGGPFSEAYYAKLRVSYNSEGILNQNSGLYYSNIEDCYSSLTSIGDMVGEDFLSSNGGPNDDKNEAAIFAVAPVNASGVQKVFIKNDRKIFRFTLSSNSFSYDNYIIDLAQVFNTYSLVGDNSQRTELEVIRLQNGNYRLATTFFRSDPVLPNLYFSAVTLDLNTNGSLISGTEKLCEYYGPDFIYEPTGSYSKITGLELSPNGSNLFISHLEYGLNNATLDVWNVDSVPVKTELSTNSDFKTSQIEATVDGSIMIPSQNYLAKISNPNATPTINETEVSISNYNNTYFAGRNFVRLLQDQVDGESYQDINPTIYEAFEYDVTSSATWEPNTVANSYNNNPLVYGFGSVVNIEKELRIKAGTVLTIENMTFKFSPGARVVIENGSLLQQGGKLILNNVVFTSNDNCNGNEIWLGVEVWGNQNWVQGNISNSRQGRLVMNNSTIENASIGVLVSKRNSTLGGIPIYNTFCEVQSNEYLEVVHPFSFENAQNGGIVQASNSTFLNNQRGVMMRPYTASANNLSDFYRSNFVWNDTILTNVIDLVHLNTVLGVSFRGCNFKNDITTAPYKLKGNGILAYESQFTVTPHCTFPVPGNSCNNPIPSTFKNLNFGIRTTNFTNTTFTCTKNKFINNRYGVYVKQTKNEKILQNTFEVREDANYQSAGVSLYYSTGYEVQENEFFEHDNPSVANGTGQSYGVVVNNSGNNSNEIYKNYFHNLKVGGQTEGLNGMYVQNPTADSISGLQWLCNDFQHDIYEHDLTLMYGRMNYHQGSASGGTSYLDTKKRVANNKFSLTGENSANEHDIFVSDNSQHFSYTFTKASRLEPDSYTFANNLYGDVVDINEALWYGNSITEDVGACPSKINVIGDPVIGFPFLGGLKSQRNELIASIDDSKTDELLFLIESGKDVQVKNELMAASPYLSDTVLIKYINSNPPNGHLKQIMIANSNLSDNVKEVLVNHKMPNGIANQIADAQKGISKRAELYSEVNYLGHQLEVGYSKLISEALLNESDTTNIENVISILEEIGDYERAKLLLSTYITIGDKVRAVEQREVLNAMDPCPYFIELTEIQEKITPNRAIKEALEESPEIVSQLEDLVSKCDDPMVTVAAQGMLDLRNESEEVPEFLTAVKSKSGNTFTQQKEVIDLHRSFNVSIYPNPTTGIVNFDYPDNNTGTLEVQVVSLDGKLKAELVAKDTNGEQLNLNHLNKGFYLVIIKLDGQLLETQKLEIF